MANFNVKIPIDQLKDRVCECGGFVFTSAVVLKELPAIYSPSGKPDSLIQPAGFMCARCGRVIPMLPEIKEEEKPRLVVAQ